MIYVYYAFINKENHDKLLKSYLKKFTIDFQQKILSYKRWEDAQLSLLGRLLLKHGLKKNFYKNDDVDIEMCYTLFNKPYFKDERIKFNISHSGNIVICAISQNTEVGLDIEEMAIINTIDFKYHMTFNEWELILKSKNEKEGFYNYWTQKEAVIKACGEGLSIPLKAFEILNNKTKIRDSQFFIKEIKIDEDYKCHLAYTENNVIVSAPEEIFFAAITNSQSFF